MQSLADSDLFADDPKRGQRLTAVAVGIYLSYSKKRIVEDTTPGRDRW